MHISKSFSFVAVAVVVLLCTAAVTLSPAVQAANESTATAKTAPLVGAGTWHVQTVDSSGSVGDYSSLALTSTGWPAISYRLYSPGTLKYAYKA